MLNEIGARNAIGRVDLVENRFVGIKSRGCYETPGGTLLLTAHRELEALCLSATCRTSSSTSALKYAEIAYFGLWFTPLRESLAGLRGEHAARCQRQGDPVALQRQHRSQGRQSQTSLYRPDIASFTMGASYEQKDADGFIRILGLPARSRALVHAESLK